MEPSANNETSSYFQIKKEKLLLELEEQNIEIQSNSQKLKERYERIQNGLILLHMLFVILYVLKAFIDQFWVFSEFSILIEVSLVGFVFLISTQRDSLLAEIKSSSIFSYDNVIDVSHVRIQSPSHFFVFRDILETIKIAQNIQKNVLDKLFEKLKTFSTTWLAVTGTLLTSVIIESILNQTIFDFFEKGFLISGCLLLWCFTQNAYGIINYSLLLKSNELLRWFFINWLNTQTELDDIERAR